MHYLIATLFLDRPEGALYVRYRSGDRSDHAAANLQWVSKVREAAVTDDQVALVGALHRAFKISKRDMARRVGITESQVGQIIKRLNERPDNLPWPAPQESRRAR